MKLNIRLIAFLLSLIMVIGMLAACDNGNDETTVDPNQSEEAPSSDESTGSGEISTPDIFNIIVNNESKIRIIRPEGLTSDDAPVAAAVSLRNDIEESTGVRVNMYDDFKKPTEEYDSSTLEILVGYTAYPQTAEVIPQLKYSDYAIKAVGNKIVVFGFTDDAIKYAAQVLGDIIESCKTGEEGNVSVSIPLAELNTIEEHSGSSDLAALPFYDGTAYSAYYESNTDCQEIILDNATVENYNAYIAKLQSSGYTKYTDNDINGNIFTTLYNSKYTLSVGYYEYANECRIIMEPFDDKTLIGLKEDNKYTAVTTSQITMLGCEYVNSEGSNVGNGLSLLYRLADGSFVIVDGGHHGNSSTWANNLIKAIKEQSKDYVTKNKDIRIAAWFISHPHGDHMGTLNNEHTLFKQFTVERVIGCFMSESEYQRSLASSYGDNFGGNDSKYAGKVRDAAAAMGAEFIVAHVGQEFFFADTVFEILYTIESYGPTVTNALNTTTILVRSVTTDTAGNETSVMVMGDVTGPAMAICNKMYGDYMRSNIVQVAHHGYSTWGNDGAMASSYRFMSPEIVLWPQGTKAFAKYKEKSYNKVLWDGTNKNFQQLYVGGWNNTQHIVPLPYNGDVNTIISNITVQP